MHQTLTSTLARMIDHALLSPAATLDDVRKACRLGKRYTLGSICVRPSDVRIAVAELRGSETPVSTVIGFPHGTTTTTTKRAEAIQAAEDGARELDMVLNIGRLLSSDYDYVESNIAEVCHFAHDHDMLLKVIFETCYLSDAQKIIACKICSRVGVDFVKTSTGFGTSGATEADVRLMRAHTPKSMGVKASGGIRDLTTLLHFIKNGASRIGTSSTEVILKTAQTMEDQGELVIPKSTVEPLQDV